MQRKLRFESPEKAHLRSRCGGSDLNEKEKSGSDRSKALSRDDT